MSPFPPSTSTPGHGHIHLSLLPPSTPSISTLSYTYPLKLVPSHPHTIPYPAFPPTTPTTVPLLFLLTYGGGLLPTDHIHLSITLAPCTRLTITTQGSTKIFGPPAPAPSNPSPTKTATDSASQTLHAHLSPHTALWLAPDPIQPFANSTFTQLQTFTLHPTASLGFVDWVSEGRRARGERWDLGGYWGRNEVWRGDGDSDCDCDCEGDGEGLEEGVAEGGVGKGDTGGVKERIGGKGKGKGKGKGRGRLLVRDSVVLEGEGIKERMAGKGVFGTVVLVGEVFTALSQFFLEEFSLVPRIGGRDWGVGGDTSTDTTNTTDTTFTTTITTTTTTTTTTTNADADADDEEEGEETKEDTRRKRKRESWRKRRLEREKRDGVVWTACAVRGGRCTVVKFSATEVAGGRGWLGEMLGEEGGVEREFGGGWGGGLFR